MRLKLLGLTLFACISMLSKAQTGIKKIIQKHKNVEDIQIESHTETMRDSASNTTYDFTVNEVRLSKDDDRPRDFKKVVKDFQKLVGSKKYKIVSVDKDGDDVTQILRLQENDSSELIVYEQSEDEASLISLYVKGLPKSHNSKFPIKYNGKTY